MLKLILPKLFVLTVLAFVYCNAGAQFDPAAGVAGSKALHADSTIFISWVNSCEVERGKLNIADTSNALASYGDEVNANGKSDGAVVSLGDGGIATLYFSPAIVNGPGADFAVFENSFSDTYLELAFVEVSSDGEHFVRFPAVSNTDTSAQVNSFGNIDPTKIYNLAGKYRVFYGTPFDLEELKDSQGLDINKITHVRVVDVIGTIDSNFCTRDSRSIKVNDPYPTAFESGGFDLDAVGVIYNENTYSSINVVSEPYITFPSIMLPNTQIELNFKESLQFQVYDASGKTILTQERYSNSIVVQFEKMGVYIIRWRAKSGIVGTQKVIVKK